jgi:hypothetical protein
VLTLDLKGRLVWGVTLVLTPKAQEFDWNGQCKESWEKKEGNQHLLGSNSYNKCTDSTTDFFIADIENKNWITTRENIVIKILSETLL